MWSEVLILSLSVLFFHEKLFSRRLCFFVLWETMSLRYFFTLRLIFFLRHRFIRCLLFLSLSRKVVTTPFVLLLFWVIFIRVWWSHSSPKRKYKMWKKRKSRAKRTYRTVVPLFHFISPNKLRGPHSRLSENLRSLFQDKVSNGQRRDCSVFGYLKPVPHALKTFDLHDTWTQQRRQEKAGQ